MSGLIEKPRPSVRPFVLREIIVVRKGSTKLASVDCSELSSFYVRCFMCRERRSRISDETDHAATNVRMAGRFLRRAGWTYRAQWGWICPNCSRTGCVTVTLDSIPEFIHQVNS